MSDRDPVNIADLIAAEQARARRLHPHDHVGHPEQTNMERLDILLDEVDEVDAEVRNGIRLMLAWELIQVAAVAAAWAERIMVDNGITAADMLQLIENGVGE